MTNFTKEQNEELFLLEQRLEKVSLMNQFLDSKDSLIYDKNFYDDIHEMQDFLSNKRLSEEDMKNEVFMKNVAIRVAKISILFTTLSQKPNFRNQLH